MQKYLKIVGNGQRTMRDLTPEEAEEAIELVLNGQASDVQIAALMAALRIKEETGDELAIFARALRRYSQRIPDPQPGIIDICVPYDGRSKAFSLLPAAVFIAAACGAKIALHGRIGQNTPPKFGLNIGDIFKLLGIPVDLSLDDANALLKTSSVAVAYVDVTQFSPRLEQFNHIRLDYGMRSFLNTIEKLINPFNAEVGMIGVFHEPVLKRVAEAMKAQGYKRGIAVQGTEGAIDILPGRRTKLIEFESEFREWTIDPAQFDWWLRAEETETVTAENNVALTLEILKNTAPLYHRRGALLTAALILYLSGATFEPGLNQAQAALENHQALTAMETAIAAGSRDAKKPV